MLSESTVGWRLLRDAAPAPQPDCFTVSVQDLPQLLQRFRLRAPDVEPLLRLSPELARDLCAQLAAGGIPEMWKHDGHH